MSAFAGPTIVRAGLVNYLDAADNNSYPGSGNTWYDISGNQKHANIVSLTYASVGYFTNFSGTQYASVGNNPFDVFPNGTTNRTISIGIRTPSTLSGYQHIFHYGNSTQNQSFGLALYSGYLSNHTWSGNSRTTTQLSAGKDYILTVVFDNGASPRNTFYINGLPMTTTFDQGMSADYAINTGISYAPVLGTRIMGPLESFGADARIYFSKTYNRALTTNEITRNFNALRGRFGL